MVSGAEPWHTPGYKRAMKYYYVYILSCVVGSYYTGITDNPERRLAEHEGGVIESCYTYRRRPLTLVHMEQGQDIFEVINREKQIKRWSRKKKEALANGDDELLNKYAACLNSSHYSNKRG